MERYATPSPSTWRVRASMDTVPISPIGVEISPSRLIRGHLRGVKSLGNFSSISETGFNPPSSRSQDIWGEMNPDHRSNPESLRSLSTRSLKGQIDSTPTSPISGQAPREQPEQVALSSIPPTPIAEDATTSNQQQASRFDFAALTNKRYTRPFVPQSP